MAFAYFCLQLLVDLITIYTPALLRIDVDPIPQYSIVLLRKSVAGSFCRLYY